MSSKMSAQSPELSIYLYKGQLEVAIDISPTWLRVVPLSPSLGQSRQQPARAQAQACGLREGYPGP